MFSLRRSDMFIATNHHDIALRRSAMCVVAEQSFWSLYGSLHIAIEEDWQRNTTHSTPTERGSERGVWL
jgi:hypothetical protein